MTISLVHWYQELLVIPKRLFILAAKDLGNYPINCLKLVGALAHFLLNFRIEKRIQCQGFFLPI